MQITLTKEQVEKLSLKKQIVFIDLAVPRDMEPGLSEIEGVELYTIDDFKLSGPSAATIQSMEQAEAIIQEEIDDFYDSGDQRGRGDGSESPVT